VRKRFGCRSRSLAAAVNINVFAQLVWFTAVNFTTAFSTIPRAASEKTKI